MRRKSVWILFLMAAVLLSACSTGRVPVAENGQKPLAAAEAAQPENPTAADTAETPAAAAQTATAGASITVSKTVPTNSFPETEMVNVTQEIVLTSTVEYRTPYTEAAIHAVFTGPNGQKMTVPGFWDGEQTWKIRFAAPDEGQWSYETFCTNTADTGLHGQ